MNAQQIPSNPMLNDQNNRFQTNPQNEEILQAPELFKVNADMESNAKLSIFAITFFILTIFLFLITIAFPDAVKYTGFQPCFKQYQIETDEFSCQQHNTNQFSTYPKVAFMAPNLSKHNVFLNVIGIIKYKSPDVETTIELKYKVTLYFVNVYEDQIEQVKKEINQEEHVAKITCKRENENSQILQCEEFELAYITLLEHESYLFIVDFEESVKNYEQFGSDIKILNFRGRTVHTKFTYSLLILRYVFFSISLITALGYLCKMSQLMKKYWVVEQKLILWLSFGLPLFNDPLYAATILSPNPATAIIGAIFMSTEISLIVLFWLVTQDRMVYEGEQRESKALDCKKGVLVFIIWILMILSYSLLLMRFFDDPTAVYETYQGVAFLVFKVFVYIVLVVTLLCLLFLFYQFGRSFNRIQKRYKILGLLNVYFVILITVLLFFGTFQTYQFEGARILISIAQTNLYIYFLQYMFVVSREGLNQQRVQEQKKAQTELFENQKFIAAGQQIKVEQIEVNAEEEQKPAIVGYT